MGAPVGNKFAAGPRDRVFSDAVKRAVLEQDGAKLRRLAEVLLDRALSGDIMALREVADRLEGKPPQSTEITGPDGGSLKIEVVTGVPG